MLKLRAFLILFSIILLVAVLGNAEARRFEETANLDNEVPLDFLTFTSGKEVEAMFGYEIVEFVHRERLQCSISHSKEELKFTEKMDLLMRYFKHTKQTVVHPEFEVLARENTKDIEENFHNTFRDMEVSHLQKLSRMQTRCDEGIELYMDDRLELIMDYATTLYKTNEAEFDKLLVNMNEYQTQLENGLNDCIAYMERNNENKHFEKAGMSYDLCYGNEVVILDKFITKFQTLARELTGEPDEKEIVQLPDVTPDKTKIEVHELPIPERKPEKPTSDIESTPPEDLEDDEDSDYEPSGKGEPETTSTMPLTEEQDPITAILKKITEPSPRTKSTTPPAPETTMSVAAKTDLKQNIANNFFNSLEPGPVIIKGFTEKAATTELPETTVSESVATVIGGSDIGEEAFKKVKAMQEAAKEKESSEQSRAFSKSDTEEKDLDIDIELPGVDVEIDESGIKVDAQGAGEVGIIFDPVPTTEAPEHDHHGKHDFKTLFFIYFFATLGVLLAITMCVLLVVIVRLKLAKTTSSGKKDQPLLSEEDKITILKQSGYVNPTYKFFDEVKDV